MSVGKNLLGQNRSAANAQADFKRMFGPFTKALPTPTAPTPADMGRADVIDSGKRDKADRPVVYCPACGLGYADDATRLKHIKESKHVECTAAGCLDATEDYLGPFIAKDLRGYRAHTRFVHEPGAREAMREKVAETWERKLQAGMLGGSDLTQRWHGFIKDRPNRVPSTNTTWKCREPGCDNVYESQAFDLDKTDYCPNHRTGTSRYLPGYGLPGVKHRTHGNLERPTPPPARDRRRRGHRREEMTHRNGDDLVAVAERVQKDVHTLLEHIQDQGSTSAREKELEKALADANRKVGDLEAKLALVKETLNLG
jgi:hypothetical protein